MDFRTLIIIFLTVLLLAAIGVSGFLYIELEDKPAPFPIPPEVSQPPQTGEDNSEEIEIYYLTPDHAQLVRENRLILQTSTITQRIRKALEELLNTKKAPSHVIAPIPEGTQLQSVYWSETDGKVYISFSSEIIENEPGHTLGEWAVIYSIVNTAAAQSATVKEIQLLIDGKIIDSNNTNWDWSRPFRPDKTFVRY